MSSSVRRRGRAKHGACAWACRSVTNGIVSAVVRSRCSGQYRRMHADCAERLALQRKGGGGSRRHRGAEAAAHVGTTEKQGRSESGIRSDTPSPSSSSASSSLSASSASSSSGVSSATSSARGAGPHACSSCALSLHGTNAAVSEAAAACFGSPLAAAASDRVRAQGPSSAGGPVPRSCIRSGEDRSAASA